MNKDQLITLVNETEMPQIRSGETHRFIDIWIVTTEERIFCRGAMSDDGWYYAFQNEPNGAIKFGNVIVKVKGSIPDDLDEINPKVNEGYLAKYGGKYPRIAHQAIEPSFMASTMEFVPVLDE